jgi:acetyl-CoA carboxylase biotin carboxyl carrier protein
VNGDVSVEHKLLLDEICRQAISLLAAAPSRPSRISLRAGEISVEVEWPAAAQPLPETTLSQVAPPVAAVAVTDQGGGHADGVSYVTAATVGTFYRGPEPGARPFAVEGDQVAPGQQLGILEAMKMMLPVQADQAGTVVRFLVQDGAPVEFDAQLIELAAIDAEAG